MTDNGELKITGVSCTGTVTIITIIFFNQKLMLPIKEKKCLEQLYEVMIHFMIWFMIQLMRWRRRTTIVMVKSPSIVMDYGTMDIACFPIHVSFMKLT